MDEMVLREFVPGIGVGPDDTLFLCPGCWAANRKRDVPEGSELVAWFQAAIWLLDAADYDTSDLNAAKLAKDYEEEPWHVD